MVTCCGQCCYYHATLEADVGQAHYHPSCIRVDLD
jgi:hypothetical protein